MIKKIAYVILGGVIGVALYFGSVFILIVPIQKASGHSAESFLGLAFLIVMLCQHACLLEAQSQVT
jgi:hypothetical protein